MKQPEQSKQDGNPSAELSVEEMEGIKGDSIDATQLRDDLEAVAQDYDILHLDPTATAGADELVQSMLEEFLKRIEAVQSDAGTVISVDVQDSIRTERVEQLEDQIKEAIEENPSRPHAEIHSTRTGNDLSANPDGFDTTTQEGY